MLERLLEFQPRIATTQKAEETSWQQYPVWCLHKKRNNAGDSWVDAVAKAVKRVGNPS